MSNGGRNNKLTRRRNRKYNRRNKSKRSNQITFTRAIFPKRMLRKFVYTDTININPALAGIGTHVFRLNSLYDPDQSGTGHQPMGFDELIPFYDHYYVLSAKITAQYVVSASTAGGFVCGIAIRDTNTSIGTDRNAVMENPNTKYKVNTWGSYNNNEDHTISYPVSIKKFLGVSKVLDNKELSGTVSSNPTEDVTGHLFVFPNDAIDMDEVLVNVRIEYYAMLVEPKPLFTS